MRFGAIFHFFQQMEPSRNEHIRIRTSGCIRNVDVNQIITDFALDSEDDDESDEEFDVQAEVEALYSAVKNAPLTNGLESSDSEYEDVEEEVLSTQVEVTNDFCPKCHKIS